MGYDKDPNELGALWVRVSQNGRRFMSGTINGVEVVCFENTNKKGKQPDWRVMKSQPRPSTPARETASSDDDQDVGF